MLLPACRRRPDGTGPAPQRASRSNHRRTAAAWTAAPVRPRFSPDPVPPAPEPVRQYPGAPLEPPGLDTVEYHPLGGAHSLPVRTGTSAVIPPARLRQRGCPAGKSAALSPPFLRHSLRAPHGPRAGRPEDGCAARSGREPAPPPPPGGRVVFFATVPVPVPAGSSRWIMVVPAPAGSTSGHGGPPSSRTSPGRLTAVREAAGRPRIGMVDFAPAAPAFGLSGRRPPGNRRRRLHQQASRHGSGRWPLQLAGGGTPGIPVRPSPPKPAGGSRRQPRIPRGAA